MIYKDYKVDLDFLFVSGVINFQDLGLHLSSFLSSYQHALLFFPQRPSQTVLSHSPLPFDYELSHQLLAIF